MLKAFYPSQFGRKDSEVSRKVYGCNVKEDNLGLPSPLPHDPSNSHHDSISQDFSPTYLKFKIAYDCHLPQRT